VRRDAVRQDDVGPVAAAGRSERLNADGLQHFTEGGDGLLGFRQIARLRGEDRLESRVLFGRALVERHQFLGFVLDREMRRDRRGLLAIRFVDELLDVHAPLLRETAATQNKRRVLRKPCGAISRDGLLNTRLKGVALSGASLNYVG
jgi:hypothetical protein